MAAAGILASLNRESEKDEKCPIFLLYQPEIGNYAMFADFIFPLDARS
jgi:hypothetical protein